MHFLVLSILQIALSNKCQSVLSQEGQSLIQLLVGDHMNAGTQSKALGHISNSGKEINDFGHYDACQDQKGSHYLLIDIKVFALPTKLGVCVPKECSKHDLKELLENSRNLNNHNLGASSGYKISIHEPKTLEMEIGGYLTFTGVSLLLILTAYSTYVTRKQKDLPGSGRPTRASALLQCFSFTNNWAGLFNRPVQDSTIIFDGVRAITTLWIVYGHVYLLRLLDVIKNLDEVPKHYENPFSAIGYTPYIGVDTFFWLSGFLFGYLIVQENEKARGRIKWGLSIVSRILRILPLYMFILIFINFGISTWASGPKSYHIKDHAQGDCPEYWWTNILFINNYVPDFTGNNCIGQSWYLAVDMQSYLVCVVLMIIYFRAKKIYFWVIVGLILIASTVYRLVIADHYDVYMALLSSHTSEKDYNRIHTNGLSRIPPYLVGILSGLVFNFKKFGKTSDPFVKFFNQIFNSQVKSIISFVLGFALFNFLIWIPVSSWSDNENDYVGYSRGFNIFYMGCYGILSSISFSCMFLPMLYEAIPIIPDFLAWTFWVPFARASFCIYFVHIAVIRVFLANERLPYIYSFYSLIVDFMYMGLVSTFIGFLVYTLVEAPLGSLLKLLLGRAPAKKDKLIEVSAKEQEMK